MKFLFSLVLFLTSTPSVLANEPTLRGRNSDEERRLASDNISMAKEAIEQILQTDKQLAASFVRLGFHDCVGGCDGCLDLSNPDNNGLDEAITALDNVVATYGPSSANGLSRADIWALAALTAAEVAQPNNRDKTLFPLVWYGRSDCDESQMCKPCNSAPECGERNGPCQSFPSPNLATDGLLDFFSETFDFDDEETVAIMGAHTLGKAFRENSGFDGEQGWVPQDDVLNNNYYEQLLGKKSLENDEDELVHAPNWKQIFIDNSDLPHDIPNRFQWVKGGNEGGGGGANSGIFMLDSDVAIVRDFIEYLHEETGEVTCEFKTKKEQSTRCPFASVIDVAKEYRDDNKLWVEDFQVAFSKMLVTGYDTSDGCGEAPCQLN